MAKLVDREELKVLLPLLESNLPYSLSVKCMVQLLQDEKLPDHFNVWTDSLVCPSAVVVCGDKTRCTNVFYRQIILMYGRAAKNLISILNHKNVMDTSETLLLYGVPDPLLREILASTSLGEMVREDSAPGNIYGISATDILQKRSVPEGFYAASLTPELSDTITSHWKFDTPGFSDVLKDALNSGLPTVCVFDTDNEPVAWAVQKQFGFVGNLHVKEEHRGKGLGKFVLSNIASQVIQRDKAVYVEIEVGNDISVKLHEGTGFKKRCTEIFQYIWCRPKKEQSKQSIDNNS